MTSPPEKHKVHNFPNQGVLFFNQEEFEIETYPVQWESNMLQKDSFHPFRLLINYKIKKDPNIPCMFELYLYFTQADLDFAEGILENIKFAYWDGAIWNTVPSLNLLFTPKVPYFRGTTASYIGYAKVEFDEWGPWSDPTISVGK